ncbi:MAG: amidohydrolase family protein [Pseudorhodobacter sp.]
MLSRRCFLLSSTSATGLFVAGCDIYEPEVERPSDLPKFGIDIHTHVFNATDIPIPGFLGQVFFRSPEKPVSGNYPTSALIRLITDIFLTTTRTAAQELASLSGLRTVSLTDAETLRERDKRVVAEGIREFEQQNKGLNAEAMNRDGLEDARLMQELNQLAGGSMFAMRGSRDLGTAVAEAVFDDPVEVESTQSFSGGGGNLAQNLKWAALLTRDRKDILGELIRLYGLRTPKNGGAPVGIRAFSPSLVDFEYWFLEKPQTRFSPIPDQIALMSRLARLEQRAVLLNFVPFCPLRAAIKGDAWHQVIRDAITNRGFVGMKLYPPMGFKPIGNPAGERFGQRAKVSGAAIDRELRRMYRWCERNGVPIKAHGNNSLAAGQCSGRNAAPNLWAPVLEEFPELRVNIAHFGGFEEETPTDACADDMPSYEERVAALITRFDNAYVDLGYWNEVAGRNRPGRAIVQKVNALLADHDRLGSRIMYGSDYTMIGREPQHGSYLTDLRAAIARLEGVEEERIFSLNAQSFLQLDDPDSPTRRRLRRFFPRNHAYFQAVGE